MLPDDVLLETFHFYVYDGYMWQSLVHVCRRWRSIVFGSPRYLDLQLVCTPRTPARDMLDVWPALPLVVQCGEPSEGSADNIIAPLERSDRVCQVRLSNVRISKLETFLAVMQKPFPELTHLELWSDDRPRPLIPESFLDGSAPRLEYLYLAGVQFPRLPKLLSSTTHLNSLKLNIPHSEYISPDAMGTALSALTSLKSFGLEFPSSHSRPDQESRGPPPSTRSALPVLRDFEFKGASEYLDDLVAHIDTPQLNKLEITFFENVALNAPQLIQSLNNIECTRYSQYHPLGHRHPPQVLIR
jgi:F-box-like